MVRSSTPVSFRTSAITIGGALLVALLTGIVGTAKAAVSRELDRKVDASRFVADSINHHYELREIRNDVRLICRAVRGGCP